MQVSPKKLKEASHRRVRFLYNFEKWKWRLQENNLTKPYIRVKAISPEELANLPALPGRGKRK